LKRLALKFSLAVLVGIISFYGLPFLVFSLGYHWITSIVFGICFFGVYLNTSLYLFLEKVSMKGRFQLISILVACVIYTVTFYDQVTFKTNATLAEFGDLHPMLQLAVRNLDKKTVVTDITRDKKFYKRRGLKENKNSPHYIKNGWSNAVDIRTNGEGFIRNSFVRAYFWVLGFDTLRHVGTSDHLHVQIPRRLM